MTQATPHNTARHCVSATSIMLSAVRRALALNHDGPSCGRSLGLESPACTPVLPPQVSEDPWQGCRTCGSCSVNSVFSRETYLTYWSYTLATRSRHWCRTHSAASSSNSARGSDELKCRLQLS
eukprot:scaffold3121_cov365-Prasinococcus_capsulatus_cf.AAC.2